MMKKNVTPEGKNEALRQLQLEQNSAITRGGISTILSAAALAASAIWLPSFIRFPSGSTEGVIFAVRANIIPAIVLMIAIRYVARIRFSSTLDNRGSAFSAPSPRLAVPAAFLQNTLEQTMLWTLSSIALAATGSPSAMAYISAGMVLFVAGRIAFFISYSAGAGARSFGMVMTMIPTTGAIAWVLVSWVL